MATEVGPGEYAGLAVGCVCTDFVSVFLLMPIWGPKIYLKFPGFLFKLMVSLLL